MKEEIVNCLTWFMNRVAETTTYESWSNDYKVKAIKNASDKMYAELAKHINIETLTAEEAKELRFCKWSDEMPNLWLFPLWMLPLIPEGMMVMDISGETYPFERATADDDIRFGCLAYGIEVKSKDVAK